MHDYFLHYKKSAIITVFLILSILSSYSVYASIQEASTAPPVCGNGIVETGEQCDGNDLGGASCTTQGFTSGSLSCNSNCTFNTSACTTAPSCDPHDFNCDGLINYRDLSILLYWFGKTGSEISRYDFNKDGKINFVDISIFLYHWKDE